MSMMPAPLQRALRTVCVLLLLTALAMAGLWPGSPLHALSLPVGLVAGLVVLVVEWRASPAGNAAGPEHGRCALALEHLRDAVLATDEHLILLMANPAADRLLGKPAAPGRPVLRQLQIETGERSSFEQNLRAVLAHGDCTAATGTGRLQRDDGEIRQIAYHCHRLRATPRAGLLLLIEDVSDQHAIGLQLQQTSKLEAMGRLTGGIAHDFNNMLAAVTGAAEMIQVEGEDPERRRQHSTTILQATAQAADLTGKLLAYARKQPDQRQGLDARTLLRNTCDLLQHSVGHAVDIVCETPSETCLVNGHAGALVNALLNLGLNARDAMPDGGTLSLGCQRVRLDRPRAAAFSPGLQPGDHVLISIADTGTGIDAEALPSIFDPFFTTKGSSGGTGLGLAAVAGTVRSHQGGLAVDSRLGHGSTFTIALPMLTGDLDSRDKPISTATLTAWRGQGTVLLVDDDEHVRSVGRAQLQALGLQVLCAATGEEALQCHRDQGDRIDVVLLDLLMPDCNGADVFEQLHAWDPDLPILIASGHPGGIDVDRMLSEGAVGFLQKPYRRVDLIRILRRLLPSAEGGVHGTADSSPQP